MVTLINYARILGLLTVFLWGLVMLLRLLLGFWLLLSLSAETLADAVSDARKPVDELNQELIVLMKGGKTLGFDGRFKKIDPVVRKTFMFEAVAQIALGLHWKKLEETQKLAFMDKYRELSSATYASQFKEFGGEVFDYESGQEIKSGRVMLRYNLVAPREKHVFEYQLSEFNGEWRIINIVVDGISDLALKKAQYTSVIDREGFDALIARLGQKIEDYSKNSEG